MGWMGLDGYIIIIIIIINYEQSVSSVKSVSDRYDKFVVVHGDNVTFFTVFLVGAIMFV